MLFFCFALVTWTENFFAEVSQILQRNYFHNKLIANKSWGQNCFAEWIILNSEESGHWNDEWQRIGVYFIAQLSPLIIFCTSAFFYLLSDWSVQLIWKISLAGEVYGVAAGELIVSYSVAGTTKWSNCSIWFLLLLVLSWEQNGTESEMALKRCHKPSNWYERDF